MGAEVLDMGDGWFRVYGVLGIDRASPRRWHVSAGGLAAKCDRDQAEAFYRWAVCGAIAANGYPPSLKKAQAHMDRALMTFEDYKARKVKMDADDVYELVAQGAWWEIHSIYPLPQFHELYPDAY